MIMVNIRNKKEGHFKHIVIIATEVHMKCVKQKTKHSQTKHSHIQTHAHNLHT